MAVKASELIKQLEKMIEKHGDLNVVDGSGWPAKVQYSGACKDVDNPNVVYPAEFYIQSR